ncbi:hypothetical protein AYO44_14570 [Planctomycetaceae bacterium SCGC AG-212-F19]|nr:hypothetical protein AYO44_14570 [Planctomycetaceae bacterium SCGC AG-212-F19]
MQVQAPEPVQPVVPNPATLAPEVPLPLQPGAGMGATSLVPAGLFGTAGGYSVSSVTTAAATAATAAPAAAVSPSLLPAVTPETSSSVVGGAEAVGRATSDAGDLLRKSVGSPGVETRFVSPYANDVHVRSYHVGQVVNYADGGFFFPARDDLDTALSKIDSRWIQDVTLIKGPYSVRYGPGFAFIDIQTFDTPRYQDGWQVHGATSLDWHSNTSDWRGIQTIWGGNESFGFRVGYDLATGGDFRSGGQSVVEAAEYNLQNWIAAVGFDLGPHSRLEFVGLRQEEHPRLLPGYFMDIDFMGTDAFSTRYVFAADCFRFAADGWINYTKYSADNFRPSKRESIGALNDFFNGFPLFTMANGDSLSSGGRAVFTAGMPGELQVSLGADVRYVNQHYDEFSAFDDPALGNSTNDGLPRSHETGRGIFADAVVPVTERLKIKLGTRVDWVTTDIDNLIIGRAPFGNNSGTSDPAAFFGNKVTGEPFTAFHNDFNLWSAFITPEYKLNKNVTLLAGFGYAQRPPTLFELYSLGTLIAVIQNPLNFYIGNPNLSAETNRQVDFGFRADYPTFRGGLSVFHSWIHNYITYDFDQTGGPSSRAYSLANTPEATLRGFEAYAEYDVRTWMTPFAILSYVRGEDETRNQHTEFFNVQTGLPPKEPLWGIPPLDLRLGLRFQDSGHQGRYGLELSARFVQGQQRAALTLLEERTPSFTILDIRSYYRPTKNFLLTAGVENLTDLKYQEHLDSRTFSLSGLQTGLFRPGITFYFGSRLEY